jgi:F-type H+-transporting ATPase subunit b
MDSEEAKLTEIQQHLEEIRARIIEMGEKEKQKIIEQAKVAAEKMIEDARAYASFQMTRARKQLTDEMVDMAISKVEERLKEEISAEDNEKLVNDFLGNLGTAKMQLN